MGKFNREGYLFNMEVLEEGMTREGLNNSLWKRDSLGLRVATQIFVGLFGGTWV